MRSIHGWSIGSSCRGKILFAILLVATVTNKVAQANKDREQLMSVSMRQAFPRLFIRALSAIVAWFDALIEARAELMGQLQLSDWHLATASARSHTSH
jgi:hypothetical protein